MNRRLLGLITLVTVLTGVAVLSTADGRRVAGSSRPAAPITPPAVGDCLLEPLPATVVDGGGIPEVELSALAIGVCTGAVFGQVAGLLPVAGSTAQEPAGAAECAATVAEFAGLRVTDASASAPGDPTDDPINWQPTLGGRQLIVVPTRWTSSLGHPWRACVALPSGAGTFTGSLRQAFGAGSLPEQFGLCWDGTDLDDVPELLPCNGPHQAELVATGWIKDRSKVLAAEMAASCRGIAALLMRTDDPTRGGLVDVVLDPVRRDGSVNPSDPLGLGCFVRATGPAELTGTVIGLADAPVPLTG